MAQMHSAADHDVLGQLARVAPVHLWLVNARMQFPTSHLPPNLCNFVPVIQPVDLIILQP